MSTATRLLMLTLVAMLVLGVFTATSVKAQDEDDDEVNPQIPEDPKVDMNADGDDDEPDNLPDEEEAEETEGINGLSAKTIFLGDAVTEQLPAGEWVNTVLAFDNADETSAYTVRFVAAHLNQIGDQNAYVQNFTGNTFERVVESKATGSFKYRFQPHASLDPRDYNLVIRVFFSTSNNETLAIAAFNSTISITEPLGTDPEMIMTFVTLFALIAGGVYWFQNKKTAAKTGGISKVTTASPVKENVEMGSGKSYEKAYVSDDHLRYQAALAKSQSPKRSTSKK